MANKTPIEWCRTYSKTADPQRSEVGGFTEGYSVNPVRFRPHGSERMVTMCQKVSEGCKHCYAETISRRFWPKDAKRRVAHRLTMGTELIPISFPGYTADGVSEHSGEFVLDEKTLLSVLKIKAPAKVFWGDMTDLFGEWVKDGWLDRMFAVCALTPHLTHIWLTKRPERMLAYQGDGTADPRIIIRADQIGKQMGWDEWILPAEWPLPNVWLGVSVENQKAAEERIPLLLQTPAAVRFLSVEPMLRAVNLERLECTDGEVDRSDPENPTVSGFCINGLGGTAYDDENGDLSTEPDGEVPLLGGIDWVICGGESGPGARPMHPQWARSLRDQCVAAGVPFFFKQWGSLAPGAQGADYSKVEDVARRIAVDGKGVIDPEHFAATDGLFYATGKKSAGRLLDGREWNEFPEVAHG